MVFDGSAKTCNGLSFNDVIQTGLKLISNNCDAIFQYAKKIIFVHTIFNRWYRQLKIPQNDQPDQLIIRRSDNKQSLNMYKLNTITYGLTILPQNTNLIQKKMVHIPFFIQHNIQIPFLCI